MRVLASAVADLNEYRCVVGRAYEQARFDGFLRSLRGSGWKEHAHVAIGTPVRMT